MKLPATSKSIFLNSICLLYILLFVYAAVSKLLDFENFQVQLGQSPLLSAFAWWVSRLIPAIELGIVVLLAFPKWRNLGLFASLILMTLFTSYIFIVLHFSSFIPCSCGGILEKMGWNTHLVFNIVFVALAVLASVWQRQVSTEKFQFHLKWPLAKSIPISIFSSIVVMIVLFLTSEDIMHHKNPFIRRYPQHPIALTHTTDLGFNSYYFSGYANNTIYLGNYTAPLHVIALDTAFQNRQTAKISFDPKNITFRMVKIVVRGNYFYLMDGSVPCIFRGKTADWKVTTALKGSPYFTLAEPIDSTMILFRSNNGKNASHILGVFDSEKQSKIQYAPKLLQQQIDGIFDTDGMLQYSEKLGKMVYVYFYRNEFIVAGKNATLDYRGHTIDTISHAQIKVAYLKDRTERKMAAPPLTVNAHTAISHHLLFVHSKVPGRYENDKLWKQSSIIDVYDLNKNTYVLSFAVYDIDKSKLRSFFVTSTYLYALIGNQLAVYELKNSLLKGK